MQTWKKVIIGVVGAMTIGAGANLVGLAVAAPQSPPNVVEVKGNCDEAEHANDPECQGPQVPEDNDGIGAAVGGQEAGEDVSGPCDEAEHANDSECQAGRAIEDRDDDGVHDDREDNSGPADNSGHSDDDENNSGPSENSGPSDDSDDDTGSEDDGPGHDGGDDRGGHGDDD